MKSCKKLAAVLALALTVGSTACAKGGSLDRSGLVLGTVCTIRILSGGSEKAMDEAFSRLEAIERVMSANAPGTVVDALNLAAGGDPVTIPDDLLFVIKKALWYAELSGGLFDPTIGPIVKLWNIGLDGERVPAPREIEEALSLWAIERWSSTKPPGRRA